MGKEHNTCQYFLTYDGWNGKINRSLVWVFAESLLSEANEITKRNETKQNKTKRNKLNERSESKRNETKRSKTKRNKTKQNEMKRSYITAASSSSGPFDGEARLSHDVDHLLLWWWRRGRGARGLEPGHVTLQRGGGRGPVARCFEKHCSDEYHPLSKLFWYGRKPLYSALCTSLPSDY